MEFFTYFIIISLILYVLHIVGYVTVGVKYQTKRQFPLLNKPIDNVEETLPDNISVINFDIKNGNVEAFYFGCKEKKPAVIVAHGNEGVIDGNISLANQLVSSGFHVLLVEYPGYGRSTGIPTEDTLLDAFTQAFDFLKEKEEVSKVVVYGSSMGGCIGANLLKNRTPDALILRSTFANFGDFIRKMAFLPKALIRNGFFNEALIKEYQGKVLIMHGTNDKTVNFSNAKKLNEVAKNSTLITYSGGHNTPNDTEVVKQLTNFFVTTKV